MKLFACLVMAMLASKSFSFDFNSPLFPQTLPEIPLQTNGKRIPSTIWIAVKSISDELPGHMKDFFARNSQWKVNVCDNLCKDKFMNEVLTPTL